MTWMASNTVASKTKPGFPGQGIRPTSYPTTPSAGLPPLRALPPQERTPKGLMP